MISLSGLDGNMETLASYTTVTVDAETQTQTDRQTDRQTDSQTFDAHVSDAVHRIPSLPSWKFVELSYTEDMAHFPSQR